MCCGLHACERKYCRASPLQDEDGTSPCHSAPASVISLKLQQVRKSGLNLEVLGKVVLQRRVSSLPVEAQVQLAVGRELDATLTRTTESLRRTSLEYVLEIKRTILDRIGPGQLYNQSKQVEMKAHYSFFKVRRTYIPVPGRQPS